MNRIIASAGLAALGVASLQASSTPGLTPTEQSKPWSVSLAVRGFYDDNYTTSADVAADQPESFGVSINPTASLNFTLEKTIISFGYNYDLRWYEDRPKNEADHIQIANLRLAHAFTERFKAELTDRFVYAQEGSVVLDGPVSTPTVLQNDADYVRNTGRLGIKAGLSERVGLELAYKSDIFDYEQEGFNSRSALLDRFEHLITLEGSLALTPKTSGLLGYQYGIVQHSREKELYLASYTDPVFGRVNYFAPAEARDNNSHYIYAGLEHSFNPELTGSIRAGVQLVDYINAEDWLVNPDDSDVIPYVDARLTWAYNPGSSATLGVVNTVSQTDVGSALSQESIAAYLNVNHRLAARWVMGLFGMFQHSSFYGGAVDGDSEMLILAGVNLNYEFGPNLSAEAGYNYDLLDSDLRDTVGTDYRSFDRNRVYVGLRAKF